MTPEKKQVEARSSENVLFFMCKALYMMRGPKGEKDMVPSLLSSGGDRHFSRSYMSYLVNDNKYKML